jgi:short-subunit dehydrogenase
LGRKSRLFSFDGKTAVITGAASGIGAALAQNLAQRGCNLALIDRDGEGLESVRKSLSGMAIQASTYCYNMVDADQILSFPKQFLSSHSHLHLVFNNAGLSMNGRFSDLPLSKFEWLMDVNFWGVVRMTKATLPLLKAEKDAQIVNISSVYGLITPANQSAYCSSKFAVRGFSNALRHELANSSVSVSTVYPGGTRTNIIRNAHRIETLSDLELEERVAKSERDFRTSAPRAAELILNGVERRKSRILVGQDAKLFALLERIAPVGYWKILQRVLD